MAYTIQFNKKSSDQRDKVLSYLRDRMAKEGVFQATLTPTFDARGRACIIVKPVRLVKAKPYCGQHPGECQVNPFRPTRKKNGHWLEWEDWIRFHNLVNRCLNRFHADADVWSNPLDVRGKMMIRKGTIPRVKWDYEESIDRFGRVVQQWNQGTDDQFLKDG